MHIIVLVSVVVLLAVVFVILFMLPLGTYIRCVSAGLPVNPLILVAMRLRNVPAEVIVGAYIKGSKAGLQLRLDHMEAHYLSGGELLHVVDALISAARAQENLTFERAAAIDLAGRDILDAVRMRVEPRVISTGEISGIAKNGVEVIVKAKITVRANLETMVGGAGEETIIARVGEGIVSAIGSVESHTDIMRSPEIITRRIMDLGLDANTAFEIYSVDISDVDVGRNIGAMLQNLQADADKKVAKAKAEGRRAMAIAQIQENKALEREMKAHLIESEQIVPMALAKCITTGKLLATRKGRERKPATTQPEPGPGVDHG